MIVLNCKSKLIDTRFEITILNESLYSKLRHAGLQCLEQPTQHVNLVSAISNKIKSVKNQALLEANVGDTKLDQVVFLSAQLLTKVILGLKLLISYGGRSQ
jgi:hypothetical protein